MSIEKLLQICKTKFFCHSLSNADFDQQHNEFLLTLEEITVNKNGNGFTDFCPCSEK